MQDKEGACISQVTVKRLQHKHQEYYVAGLGNGARVGLAWLGGACQHQAAGGAQEASILTGPCHVWHAR